MQEIAHEATTYLQRMAEAADVHLTVLAVDDKVTWKADRGPCFTLLKNLLENAIQHAPAQTSVSMEIQGNTITVRGRGPGVEAAQLPAWINHDAKQRKALLNGFPRSD